MTRSNELITSMLGYRTEALDDLYGAGCTILVQCPPDGIPRGRMLRLIAEVEVAVSSYVSDVDKPSGEKNETPNSSPLARVAR